MTVKILLFSSLATALGEREINLSVSDKITVDQLITILIDRYPAMKSFREQLAVAVNMEYVSGGQILLNDDEIALIPPVSGG